MSAAILNLDALKHNALQSRACMDRWQVAVLPVLKGIASHPLALRELSSAGFTRFGYAEYSEAVTGHAGNDASPPSPNQSVLIQLCPLSRTREIARNFSRSFHSQPETLCALDQAVGETGLPHGVMLMLDLGERREGIPLAELPLLLEHALALPHLTVEGFAFTMGCLGQCVPDAALLRTITEIQEVFRNKGVSNTAVSVGGSIFCRWLEDFCPSPVTEVRLGANFILGMDTYHKLPLPGGSFRSDVCLLQSEILEIQSRDFSVDKTAALPEFNGYPVIPAPIAGKRQCALLDVGRIHAKLEELVCPLPGARIMNISSNYMVLDVTDCPVAPRIGQQVLFRLGYWSIARLFHSFLVPVVAVRDGSPNLAPPTCGALP